MTSFLAVLTIVTIAAVTPGPNNFIVISAAVRGGVSAALPAMASIIGGSITLLVLIWAGAGTLFEAVPEIQTLLRMAGATYLVWLGISFIHAASQPATQAKAASLPETIWGVASFQLLNPKSWILTITAISAIGGTANGLMSLAAIFVVVMGLCLTLWSVAGRLISHLLVEPRYKRAFDTVMGCLLIVSAAMLLP